ncbi:hypothetical protein COI_2586 [Mannheimia haemolytica serotype A2 str. OVINE]|nr:hypothetical protein COI_2586 [Mannheimia haemolytica serotype A2 str. OVINE]EEY12108.1 hypothetical protein COK_1844 [Mannheimia haemolytica serotype A2 str. BOVINE]
MLNIFSHSVGKFLLKVGFATVSDEVLTLAIALLETNMVQSVIPKILFSMRSPHIKCLKVKI